MNKKEKSFDKKNNIVLIYGNKYSVDETIERIKSQIKIEEISKFNGEELDLYSFSNNLCNIDMFINRKIILVQDLPKDNAKKIIDVISRIPENNFVIFYSYSSLKSKKAICSYFQEYAKLIEYDIEILNTTNIIKKIVEKNKRKISEDALSLMSEYLTNDIGIIKSEINKLCNYVEIEKQIEVEDVKSVCCLNKEFVIWDLIQTIGNKEISKAEIILSDAIDSGCNYEFIILMIMRSIKLAIFLKEMDSSGINIYDMKDKIKDYKKDNGSAIYKDYEIKKTYESRSGFFNNFSLFDLLYALKSCHNTFISVRKSYKKEEQEKSVSMLLFEICFPSCFN